MKNTLLALALFLSVQSLASAAAGDYVCITKINGDTFSEPEEVTKVLNANCNKAMPFSISIYSTSERSVDSKMVCCIQK